MAATLQQVYNITQNASFQQRILAVTYYMSRQILSDPTTYPVGSRSWGLAQQALSNPAEFNVRFVNAIATDPTISNLEAAAPGSASDAQLVAAAQSVWPYLAGALVN